MLLERTRLRIARTAHRLWLTPAEARSIPQGDVRRMHRVQLEASGQPHTRRIGPGEQMVMDRVLGGDD